MNAAVFNRLRCLRFVAPLLVVALLVLAPAAVAQEEPPPEPTLRLVPVQHAQVGDVYDVIMGLGMENNFMRITADERSNALIILGSDRDLAQLVSLVELVDTPAPQKAMEGMLVVPLEFAKAKSVGITLSELLSNPRRQDATRISIDERSNSIILSGSVYDTTRAAKVVEQLDTPAQATSGSGGEMLVRIAWLVGDEKAGKGMRLPEGLDEVAKELEYFGVGAMRLATQTVVRVTSGEQFRTRFVAELEHPWRVEVEGLATAMDNETRTIGITLDATERVPPRVDVGPGGARQQSGRSGSSGRNTELRTTISTVSGHFVVLGLTPIGGMDSAFVIQVIDQ